MTDYTWCKYYNNEQELIDELLDIDIHILDKLCNTHTCRGCEYIKSLLRTLNGGSELSPAQIRQAKRLAKYVRRYHENKHVVE